MTDKRAYLSWPVLLASGLAVLFTLAALVIYQLYVQPMRWANSCDADFVADFPAPPFVHHLIFKDKDLRGISPKELRKFEELYSMYFRNCKLSPEWCEEISRIPTLVDITASDCDLTHADCSTLLGSRSVRSIDLTGSQFDDSHCKLIAKNGTISHLTVDSTNVTSQGIEIVLSRCKLEWLNVSNNEEVVLSPTALARHKTLTGLIFMNTAVGDEVLETVANLPKLEFLYASGSKCSHEALTSLRSNRPEIYIEETE